MVRAIVSSMKKRSMVFSFLLLLVCNFYSFGSGGAEGAAGKQAKQASTSPWKDARILPVYVLSKDVNRNYIEGMYIPQGIAAYYPNQFTMNGKERRIQFESRYSYRILERHLIKEDVWLYSVETSSTLTAPANSKTFTLYFNRSALIANSGEAIQPATYALERGARMSGFTSGTVRLEGLIYNEKDEQFKAVVLISP